MRIGNFILEYAVEIVMAFIMIGLVVMVVLTLTTEQPAYVLAGRHDFNQRAAFVEECIRSEQFTREECIILAGQER